METNRQIVHRLSPGANFALGTTVVIPLYKYSTTLPPCACKVALYHLIYLKHRAYTLLKSRSFWGDREAGFE